MIPEGSPQDKETEDLVNQPARRRRSREQFDDTPIIAEVGGVTAALEDQSEYMKGRMPLFIAAWSGSPSCCCWSPSTRR